MSQSIKAYVEKVTREFDQIPIKRKETLQKLALYIKSKSHAGEKANTKIKFKLRY